MEEDRTTSAGKEQLVSEEPSQTVLKLSFSDDQNLSEFTSLDEFDDKEENVSKLTEDENSQVFVSDKDETMEDSSFGDEQIEPSTDEELKIWHYPQDSLLAEDEANLVEEDNTSTKTSEELKSSKVGKEEIHSADLDEPADIQNEERCPPADVSAKISELKSKQQLCDYLKEESLLVGERFKVERDEESCSGARDDFTTEQESEGSIPHGSEQLERNRRTVGVRYGTQTSGESPPQKTEVAGGAQPEDRTESPKYDRVQTFTEASDPQDFEEGAENSVCGEQVVKEETIESLEAEEKGTSKKVTFVLEPELIHSSDLSESDTSMRSRADSSLSGETRLKVSAPALLSGEVQHTGEVVCGWGRWSFCLLLNTHRKH